jgi:hypothetical protein
MKENDEEEIVKRSSHGLKYHEGGTLPENAPKWAQAASERIYKKLSYYDSGNLLIVEAPSSSKNVLLHSCCAPCSGAMVQAMVECPTIDNVTVFFYNPNIHPRKEYMIRKEENKRFCVKLGIEFVDCDYDVSNWYARMKGMEFDPERGRRCTECFDMVRFASLLVDNEL